MGFFGFGKKKRAAKEEQIDVEELLCDAREAYDEHDYDLALSNYLKAAKTGNVEAQYFCGKIYDDRAYDDEMYADPAFYWYEKAAKQGHKDAQERLMDPDAEGHYITDAHTFWVKSDDYRRAKREWDEAAAAEKEKQAYDEGVQAFKNGNRTLALERLMPFAKKGNAEAKYFCGMCYKAKAGNILLESEDTIREYKKQAFLWVKKAAEAGLSIAQFECAQMYSSGWNVFIDMSPEESKRAIHEKDEKELYWYAKAAESGDITMQDELYNMGWTRILDLGLYDIANAVYPVLMKREHLETLVWCGKNLHNKELALRCLLRAAEKGSSEACSLCGDMYYKGSRGYGIEADKKLAADYYERSHYAEDAVMCGDMYYNGDGVAVDKEKAFRLYHWVIECHMEDGELSSVYDENGYVCVPLYKCGVMLYNGEGVPADQAKAKAYLEASASFTEQNCPFYGEDEIICKIPLQAKAFLQKSF